MNALVHSERVVTPTGVRAAWLRMEDGVIQGVGDTLDPPEAEHLVLDVAEALRMNADHSLYEGLWAQGGVVGVMRRGTQICALLARGGFPPKKQGGVRSGVSTPCTDQVITERGLSARTIPHPGSCCDEA